MTPRLRSRRLEGDLDNPDNVTVTPRGGLLLAKTRLAARTSRRSDWLPSRLTAARSPSPRNNVELTANLIAIAGKTVNPGNYRNQEFAGACYSPDGKWLFVNIQTPGITFAITGPWGNGPL